MRDDLDDYLISIGKVAIAAAFLEEVVIHWGAWLSDNPQGTLLKRLHRGLDKNLDFLADRVEERISSAKKKPVLDLIETSRSLKNKRNENIHGVWSVVANSKTVVMCSRYEKDATGNLSWDDLSTPSISEVKQLAGDLNKNAHDLNDLLTKLWDYDECVQSWKSRSQRKTI